MMLTQSVCKKILINWFYIISKRKDSYYLKNKKLNNLKVKIMIKQKIKFIETENEIVSIQASCGEIEGVTQEMQLLLCITDIEENETVLFFDTKKAKELLSEVKRVVEMLEVFNYATQNHGN